MSILGDIQRGVLGLFRPIVGQVTYDKNGVTLGPRQNAIGRTYDRAIDNFVKNTTETPSNGLISQSQKLALKVFNPFALAGNVTINKNGITLGPKRNGLGVVRDDFIDGIVNYQGNMRGFVGKALLASPTDHITIDKNGITIGPKKNAFAQFKNALVDFLK